jgi:hypothetical protein
VPLVVHHRQERLAVHLRHQQIAHHDVHLRAAPEHLERGASVVGPIQLAHPHAIEQGGEKTALKIVVVDDEHAEILVHE